jgi:hypothetical protein
MERLKNVLKSGKRFASCFQNYVNLCACSYYFITDANNLIVMRPTTFLHYNQ